jgi:putative membrane protein
MNTDEHLSRVRDRRVHMANERTFLAWIRTSIGIMAFGFVVERFGLFLKQIAYVLGQTGVLGLPTDQRPLQPGYSAFFGIALVGLGALMGLLAFVRYKKVEKQIDEGTYRPSIILDLLLALSIVTVGVFLIFYLVHTL